MRTDIHPTYEAAPADRRWRSGSLPDLWAALNAEADTKPGKFAKRVLPGGAHVSLRRTAGGRELVIFRTEPFRTAGGETAWTNELLTFGKKFDVLGWTKEPGETRDGGPMMTFREKAVQDSFFGGES